MDLKTLREKRARVWGQMSAIMDGARDAGRDLEAEEARQYDELEAELDGLTNQIERGERHDAQTARLTEVREQAVFAADPSTGEVTERTGEEVAEAFESYIRRGVAGMSAEQRTLMESRWVQPGEVRADLGTTPDSAGGYTVPEGFWARISETLKAFGGMREVANVITTTEGNNLPWPTNDDTANKATIVGENAQVGATDVVFGQRTLGAHLYSSGIVKISFQLLQDSAFDIEGYVAGKFANRFGRAYNAHFTNGTGTGQPTGIVPGVVVGKEGSGTAVTYDDLVDLVHSVDPAYRAMGAGFMLNDKSIAAIRKLVDGNGRPLWEPGVQAGVPSTIIGHPYTINQDLADIGLSAKPILFGNYNAGYVVREVRGMTTLRLTERYADFLQVGLLAFSRADAGPDDPSAVRAFQNAAA